MIVNNKVPGIRFKGFSGPWTEVSLSGVIDVRSGKDYKHLGKGDIPVYGTGGYMLSVDGALSNDEDAIGIGRKGTIDKPYILRAPFWTVDTLFYAVPLLGFNLDFLFCLFQKIEWKKHDESTGVPSLSKVAINFLPVYATNELEQTAIGNYFQKLDSLINQHQQKHDKLSSIKKSMLEKMFPKQGETMPEIRFKGFSREWEEKFLGEIATFFSGGTPLVGVEKYYKGNIPFIRSAEINKTTTELVISESGLKSSSAKIVELGTVLYALYGATSGEVGRARVRGAINQAILAIVPKAKICPEFLANWLKKNKENIVNTYLQGGQGNLSGEIVKNLTLKLPVFEEQIAIGNYFQKLDILINQHQQQITKLNNIKQACLSKMFV